MFGKYLALLLIVLFMSKRKSEDFLILPHLASFIEFEGMDTLRNSH
jgi:hypothetical protein